MADINRRTKRELQEAYEDFLFKNVMAIYAANESEKIEQEAAELGEAKPEKAKKLFTKKERKENAKILLAFGKKAFLAVASVAFVAIISLYGAMVASADVRKAVADAIYDFAYDSWSSGTFITIENPSISDDEWVPQYELGYIPEGFVEGENESYYYGFSHSVYKFEEKYYTDGVNSLIFMQFSPSTEIDEGGKYDDKKKVQIKNSEGLFLRKDGEHIRIIWSTSDTILGLAGDLDEATMLEIARSVIGGVYGENDDTEYVYDDTYSYPTEVFEIFQDNNGKYGLKNFEGQEVFAAEYDEITDELYYFILSKTDGTYEYPSLVGYRYEMVEKDKESHTVYFPNGVSAGPFETYYIEGMIDEFVIGGIADGNSYKYNYANGELTLTEKYEKNDSEREAFGYKINSVWYGFTRPMKGITDANGNEVLPPISRDIKIPFEDRAVCLEGHNSYYQAFEFGHTYIYDLTTGEAINSDFNKIIYSVFDEGYIGIAFSEDYYGEGMHEEAENAGIETLPYGWWFVDKDGNAVSERYESIEIERRDTDNIEENPDFIYPYGNDLLDFYYTAHALDYKIYAEKADGTHVEFTVKDVLIPFE